ncbi:hypothetical protein ACWCPQ_20365 [Nocardia sp. NPDC001965]
MSGGFAANPITSPFWNTAMRAMGKMRGGAYQHIVLRAHAQRLASPFDREGQVRWSKAESRRVFRESTPAQSYGARITATLAADYVDKLDRITVPTLILTPNTTSSSEPPPPKSCSTASTMPPRSCWNAPATCSASPTQAPTPPQ